MLAVVYWGERAEFEQHQVRGDTVPLCAALDTVIVGELARACHRPEQPDARAHDGHGGGGAGESPLGCMLKGVEREAPTVKGREKGYVWGVRKQGGWVGEGRVREGREGRGVMHNVREGKDGEQGSVLRSIVGLRGWRMESRGG